MDAAIHGSACAPRAVVTPPPVMLGSNSFSADPPPIIWRWFGRDLFAHNSYTRIEKQSDDKLAKHSLRVFISC